MRGGGSKADVKWLSLPTKSTELTHGWRVCRSRTTAWPSELMLTRDRLREVTARRNGQFRLSRFTRAQLRRQLVQLLH